MALLGLVVFGDAGLTSGMASGTFAGLLLRCVSAAAQSPLMPAGAPHGTHERRALCCVEPRCQVQGGAITPWSAQEPDVLGGDVLNVAAEGEVEGPRHRRRREPQKGECLELGTVAGSLAGPDDELLNVAQA
jgi:hypothetical protein